MTSKKLDVLDGFLEGTNETALPHPARYAFLFHQIELQDDGSGAVGAMKVGT